MDTHKKIKVDKCENEKQYIITVSHVCIYSTLPAHSVESYNGTFLRLFRLERRQMGAYLCIASNDVPPAVSKRVSLSVHCK